MAKPTTAKQFNAMLESVREADLRQVDSQLEIAAVLHAIKKNKLYQVSGQYDNFKMMVQCELDFPHSTASRYCSLYEVFQHWQYSKTDFTKLMRQFGWRRLEEATRSSSKKMGYRAVKSWLEKRDQQTPKQLNILISDHDALARIESALADFGLEFQDGTHRRSNTGPAMLGLIAEYERLKKATATKARRAKKAAA